MGNAETVALPGHPARNDLMSNGLHLLPEETHENMVIDQVSVIKERGVVSECMRRLFWLPITGLAARSKKHADATPSFPRPSTISGHVRGGPTCARHSDTASLPLPRAAARLPLALRRPALLPCQVDTSHVHAIAPCLLREP
ncbi:hypothetical protein EJB05_36217, partial [Eragrostis curvula]